MYVNRVEVDGDNRWVSVHSATRGERNRRLSNWWETATTRFAGEIIEVQVFRR